MALEALVCDWNGTLIAGRDDRALLESIAWRLGLRTAARAPWRLPALWAARRRLLALRATATADDEFDYVQPMYRVFNERVMRGASRRAIERAVQAHARDPRTQRRLQRGTLRVVRACRQAGMRTAVLSVAYRAGIEVTLKAAGFADAFDGCIGDELQMRGDEVLGLGLRVFRRKAEHLAGWLEGQGLRPERVAYLGDSAEDEACLAMVGLAIVSPLAPEARRARWRQRYGAFAPADDAELQRRLLG